MSPVINNFRMLLKQKEVTEKKDISLTDLERETNITRQTLQAWRDNNIKRFDRDVIEKLCCYFNCKPGDLIRARGGSL